MEPLSSKKRARVDWENPDESEFDSVEVKRLREDLLDILDDSDLYTGGQDLDSFMKSFEDEISAKSFEGEAEDAVVDLTSESGESLPELGFLFEASDDQLGLPPTAAEFVNPVETESAEVSPESAKLSELWRMDDQISSYDWFEYGYGYADGSNNGEYVALDGLFDYTDLGFGSSDFSRRPETLPAQ